MRELGQSVMDAKVPPGESEAVRALEYATTPTNQQIMDVAKAAYNSYQSAVDATTVALVNTVKDQAMADALGVLDGTNWSSPAVSPAVVQPFLTGRDLQTAVGVVKRTDAMSLSVGVFARSLSNHSPGMVGFAEDLLAVSTSGLILRLDIFSSIVSVDNSQNLQYGVWLKPPGQLHDAVIGFYLSAAIQSVPVNLKILLTKDLKPYGFVSSTGASLPVSTGLFAGNTSTWNGR